MSTNVEAPVDWVDTSEAARLMKVNRQTVIRLILTKRLKAYRPVRGYRIMRGDIARFIDNAALPCDPPADQVPGPIPRKNAAAQEAATDAYLREIGVRKDEGTVEGA